MGYKLENIGSVASVTAIRLALNEMSVSEGVSFVL